MKGENNVGNDKFRASVTPVRWEYVTDEEEDDVGSNATKIESRISLQLKGDWPDAQSLGYEKRAGDYYFPIRSDCGDRCLIVADRAYRTLAANELTDFLEDEHWLHRLQAERCLRVHLPGPRPTLVRPPASWSRRG